MFRPQTQAEKIDFQDISKDTPTIDELFTNTLNKKEKEYTIKFKPFCHSCAKKDFRKWVLDIEEEMSDTDGFINREKIKLLAIETKFTDLDKYANEDRFEFLKDSEVLNPANVAKGTKAEMHIHRDWKCKIKGCGISIYIPHDVKELPKVQDTKQK